MVAADANVPKEVGLKGESIYSLIHRYQGLTERILILAMRTGENVIRWCGGACRDIEKKDSRNVMVTGSIAVSFSTTFDEEDDDVLVVIDNSGASTRESSTPIK